MATLDTALLIRPAVIPVSTTPIQSTPTEGFHQVLEDETDKASAPAPQPRPAREARQLNGRHSDEVKTQSVPDAEGAGVAVKPEAGSGKQPNQAPAKLAKRRGDLQDSRSGEADGLTQVEAEPTQRQDLP